jgi:hypothetical protein
MEHPEWSDFELGYRIGSGCPSEHGLPDMVDDCSDCEKCWNSEILSTEGADMITAVVPRKTLTGIREAGEAAKKAAEEISKSTDALSCLASIRENAEKAGGKKIMSKSLIPETTEILDSGDRTEFETGAVRDMREGKGRFDLMPLGVVAEYIYKGVKEDGSKHEDKYLFFSNIDLFQRSNNTEYLYMAMGVFDGIAFDYTSNMLLEVAKHFEEGAKKYGPDNWKRGIPVWCYIDSAVRHFVKYLNGDTDERHDRAVIWNLMCCIWEVDYRNKEEK